MIDNIDLIKPLLTFDNEGDFYQLFVFLRKKDQPDGEKDNHQSVRTIKSYSVTSHEYLDKRYGEIKMLCEVFKARAYIHIAKQNHRDVGMNMISEIVTRIQSGQINQKNVFDSVVGQIKTQEKRWIVDIDMKDENALLKIQHIVNNVRPYGNEPKVIKVIPTKSGYHLITQRFDIMEFKKYFLGGDVPDIQKKNPTLLYYPNSLNI
jgi:hypothetical protein